MRSLGVVGCGIARLEGAKKRVMGDRDVSTCEVMFEKLGRM